MKFTNSRLFKVVQEWIFNPFELLVSTFTFKEYEAGLWVSPERIEFLLSAAGVPEEEAAKWHGWGIRGLPGAKYHAMLGQIEKTHDIRRQRANARAFRNQIIQRPNYYSSFDVH